MIYDIILYMIW